MEYRRHAAMWLGLALLLLMPGALAEQTWFAISLAKEPYLEYSGNTPRAIMVLEVAGGEATGAVMQNDVGLVERDAMDANELVQLMGRFLRRDFGIEEAQEIFGPVENDRNPNALHLKPKHPAVEWANLGMIEDKGERLLSYIFVEFSEAVQLNLDPLIAAYGPFVKKPRLKPDQPTPHLVQVEGEDFAGNLLLGLDPGKGSSRKVKTIRLMRLMKEDR